MWEFDFFFSVSHSIISQQLPGDCSSVCFLILNSWFINRMRAHYVTSFELSIMDQLEKSQTRIDSDWEKILHLFENVIVGDDDTLRVWFIIKLGHLSNCAPEHLVAQSIPILVNLLNHSSNSSNSNSFIKEATVYYLTCLPSKGDGKLTIIISQLV